jgi:hypothetical protein
MARILMTVVLALTLATPVPAPAQVAAPVALRADPTREPREPSVHATTRPWRPDYIGIGVLAGALVGAPVGWAFYISQCEGFECDGDAGLLAGMAIGAVIGGLIGLLVALPTGS